jgi:hypothetical protein
MPEHYPNQSNIGSNVFLQKNRVCAWINAVGEWTKTCIEWTKNHFERMKNKLQNRIYNYTKKAGKNMIISGFCFIRLQ